LYYIEHVHRGQWSPGRRNKEMRAIAEADGRDVEIWMEREAGVDGTARTQETVRVLDGFNVHTEPARGKKEIRADGFAAQCEAGNVRIVKGPWNRTWINELCDFPTGKNDDQVDATSQALARLCMGTGFEDYVQSVTAPKNEEAADDKPWDPYAPIPTREMPDQTKAALEMLEQMGQQR